MGHRRSFCAINVVVASTSLVARAATLPEHAPLTVLVIADEVNPNQLSDEQLTQPDDFATALQAEDSGLSLESVTTVDSQCADVALDSLQSATPPDVVLYFAHRAATSCDGEAVQEELVAALSAGLEQATGIVVLHHGLYPDLYQAGAKDSMLRLVGGSFEGIAWNTTVGQRVFNVGADHFISNNGLTYEGNARFGGVGDIAAGEYPYFDNIPDERYPDASLLTEPDEERTLLFASDSGGERVLGYVLQRPAWQRRVVAYQPGEYQPNALDARAGNNFQILANALYFASRQGVEAVAPAPSNSGASTDTPPSAETSGVIPGSGTEGESASDDTSESNQSERSSGQESGPDELEATTGDPSSVVEGSTTSQAAATSTTTSPSSGSATSEGLESGAASETDAIQPHSMSGTVEQTSPTSGDDSGCALGKRNPSKAALVYLLSLVGLVGLRRRAIHTAVTSRAVLSNRPPKTRAAGHRRPEG